MEMMYQIGSEQLLYHQARIGSGARTMTVLLMIAASPPCVKPGEHLVI